MARFMKTGLARVVIQSKFRLEPLLCNPPVPRPLVLLPLQQLSIYPFNTIPLLGNPYTASYLQPKSRHHSPPLKAGYGNGTA